VIGNWVKGSQKGSGERRPPESSLHGRPREKKKLGNNTKR